MAKLNVLIGEDCRGTIGKVIYNNFNELQKIRDSPGTALPENVEEFGNVYNQMLNVGIDMGKIGFAVLKKYGFGEFAELKRKYLLEEL